MEAQEPTIATLEPGPAPPVLTAARIEGDAAPARQSPVERSLARLSALRQYLIAGIAVVGIALHLVLRFAWHASSARYQAPLLAVLFLGGLPLVIELLIKLYRRQFGSDLLAGISIVTSVLLGEYLPGALVVLMLSGGEALESFAVRSASSVLRALAGRMPSLAHRRLDQRVSDIAAKDVAVGDILIVFPHELCPVDGEVVEGHGVMDESYLTGEPFKMSKTPGSEVLSGSINGEEALTIRATHIATDSRFARSCRSCAPAKKIRHACVAWETNWARSIRPLPLPWPCWLGLSAARRTGSWRCWSSPRHVLC